MPPRTRRTVPAHLRSKAPELPRALRQRSLLDPDTWAGVEDFPADPVAHTISNVAVVRFAPPARVESVNATNSWHHHKRAKYARAWRDAAHEACLPLADELVAFRGHRVEIAFVLPVPDRRRRDPHNFVTSVCKHATDGIVDTGLVVPDDNSEWVTVPEPWVGLVPDGLVHVQIRCAAPYPVEPPH